MKCNLCPNKCNVERTKQLGKCLADDKIHVAYSGLHMWEEPVISGSLGSGAIFFSGCTMRCVFCQNKKISRTIGGQTYTPDDLASLIKSLDETADNINLVSPTPYVDGIIEALNVYKPKKPVIMNCGGYETVETIKKLSGYINVYLPDLKYVEDNLSYTLSGKSDYFKYALPAITEMCKQVGKPTYNPDGTIRSGVIIRHLILPNHIENTLQVLKVFADNFKDTALLSLMAQYTPVDVQKFPALNRRITPLEYKRALNALDELQITNGFIQDLSAATTDYIPNF